MLKKLFILFLLLFSFVSAGTIDNNEKYAWGTDIG
jgi:hypothetical protein